MDKRYTDLPLGHEALLKEARRCVANESAQRSVLSEMHEAAAQRLREYFLDSSSGFANAWLLDLQEPVMKPAAGKLQKVETELAAHTALRRMVETLAEVLEEQCVNMTVFTPNQFAAMSVYYAKFVAKRSGREARPKNGLAQWCFGLPAFVSGEAIEPEPLRRDCLASQRLPRHYDASGAPQPAGLERACQAIAAAPVTCELCHMGLAGRDKLEQHCRVKHGGFAESRKAGVLQSSPSRALSASALGQAERGAELPVL